MKTTEYKDSEVGRIPADWTVKQIGKMGYTYSGLTGKNKEDFGKGEARYITFLNVLNNPILKTDIFETVDVKEGELQNKAIKGDLFFNTSSETPEEVGICALLNEDISNLYLNSFCFGYRLIDPDIDGLYLSYKFRSKQGRDIMSALAQGATRYNLSKEYFNKTLIAFPTIDEQKKVAKALSEIDSLLCKQNEEIEKKLMIKDGLMQELLTGKKRLKGFNDEWQSVRMEKIEIKNGSMLKSSEYEPGTVPVIAGGVSAAGYHSKANRPSNTITISGSGANAGFVNFFEEPIFASDCSTINEQKSICVKYLYYALLLKQPEIYKCQAGGAQPHVHAKDIKDIVIPMPTLKDEQVAVASVLTEIDKQIIAIESQRDKYLHIKQGMMQQLLTGKTRL